MPSVDGLRGHCGSTGDGTKGALPYPGCCGTFGTDVPGLPAAGPARLSPARRSGLRLRLAAVAGRVEPTPSRRPATRIGAAVAPLVDAHPGKTACAMPSAPMRSPHACCSP
jgi:hypothetical protein